MSVATARALKDLSPSDCIKSSVIFTFNLDQPISNIVSRSWNQQGIPLLLPMRIVPHRHRLDRMHSRR